MMKYTSKREYILGIAISARKVEAALIHDAPSGPIFIRSFSRKRSGMDALDAVMPEIVEESGSDVTFGAPDSSSLDSSLFLASEFGSINVPDSDDIKELTLSAQIAMPCDLEIQDIVAECMDAGYENIHIVFALPTDYVGASQIHLPKGETSKSKKGKKSRKKVDQNEYLFEALQSAHSGIVNPEQFTFLPLSGAEGEDGDYLGIFAYSTEPVSISLEAIRNKKRPFPNVSLMDNEISLLLGLGRASLLTIQVFEDEAVDQPEDDRSTEEETTVIVRVGAEDTLVMFMNGQELTHYESLRSITAYDPPDTICSRILLMHDEFGAGDADRMLLFCDAGEDLVFERLSQVFPGTYISRLRDVIPPMEEKQVAPYEMEVMLAVAVALKVVRDELWQSVFPKANFLNSKLRGRKIRLPFSWPVAAMILVLFSTTLFFVHKYFDQSHEIEMTRFELKTFPDDMISEDADVLQMRIDSLRSRSTGIVDALDLLDSLLIGSDVWSRALERTSVHTGDISGLWIERWAERDEGVLELTGTSIDRDQIVRFASQASANIESIVFSEIRNWPVYSFQMSMQLDRELPEAAIFLRDSANILPEPQRGRSSMEASMEAEIDKAHAEAGE